MALVIEDGSGVSDANSYVTLEAATTFFTARELDVPTEAQLLQALDVIENLMFAGSPTTNEQVLAFPRLNIVNTNLIAYGENEIPKAIIAAQLWLGSYIASGFNPASVATLAVKREKVDVLEVEYFGDSTASSASMTGYGIEDLPNAFNPIKHLLMSDSLDSDNSSDCFSSGRIDRA